jgi:hypothetical protein
VGLRERGGDLHGDPPRFIERQGARVQPVGQRRAFDVLHHEVVGTVLVSDVERRADVRMGQRGNRLRLALQTFAGARVACQFRGQHLDSHRSPEAGVLRAVDLTHSAGPKGGLDLIRAEAGAGSKNHDTS